MRTRTIIHDQWESFFSDFTQLHQGKRVNVETIDADEWGVKSELCDRELIGVVAMSVPSSVAEADESIEVIVRETSDRNSSLSIGHPDQVSVADENGKTVALQINSSGGRVTMIRFEPSNQNMPEGFRLA